MKIESDKKKERLVIILTIIGIFIVLVIWGFQLNEMFAKVTSDEYTSDIDQITQDLEEAQSVSDQIKDSIPFLQAKFSEVTDQFWQEKTDTAKEAVLDEVAEELSQELNRQLIEQTALEATEGANEELSE